MAVSAFGRWLLRAMKRRDLNASGLATLIGVKPPSVSDWIHGVTEPKTENVQNISRALSIPIADVYGALGRLPTEADCPEEARWILEMYRQMTPQSRKMTIALLRDVVEHQQTDAEQDTCDNED